MDKTILSNYMDSLENVGIPGCQCVIYHEHRPVFNHCAGYADASKTMPMTSANAFWLYSLSKISTCIAVMQLIEKGRISLDNPVSQFLPEYGSLKVKAGDTIEKSNNIMTIRHLLSMQSGMNYNLEAPSIKKILEDTDYKATTRQIIKALANEPLEFEPGTHYLYSLSHDVLAAIVEEVSEMKFSEYLYQYIFKPLGMNNTGFEFTQERKDKMAEQFEYNMDTKASIPISYKNGFILSENYESGGAGIISIANDYILFLDAISNRGTSVNGYRLLSGDSIDLMRTDQLHETSKKDFDLLGKTGYSYGLGVRTLIEKEKSGARSPLGEFGWDGAAGAYALIDVENHLAILYLMHVCGCGYGYDVIHPKIRDLAYDMLGI